jgi:hypothetical protein
MSFIIRHSKKVNFYEQNEPNNLKIDCKSPFNLVRLIENDLSLNKEFESLLEWDEVINI